MRQSLQDLFQQTIILQYTLSVDTPEGEIPRTVISTRGDDCLKQIANNDAIASLIYNGIVEYAYNDWDIDLNRLDNLQLAAFKTKIKYNPDAPLANKIGYGFHAEVMLYLILDQMYQANKGIARGYMFSPLERSEIKGYDSYMLVEDMEGHVRLFFGEAKAYISSTGYKKSVNEIFKGINKALSDDYLELNFLAMVNQYQNVKPYSKLRLLIDAWLQNPNIKMSEEAQKYDMEFVYPMFIMYDKSNTYEQSIIKVVNYINSIKREVCSTLTIPHTLFFIFLPVDECRAIKAKVIEWISQRQQLMR